MSQPRAYKTYTIDVDAGLTSGAALISAIDQLATSMVGTSRSDWLAASAWLQEQVKAEDHVITDPDPQTLKST